MRRRLALAIALVVCALGARGEPTEEEEDKLDPDYAGGRKALEAKEWPGAIRLLGSAALRDTRNSDIQNLLGFAYRNSGDLAAAFRHYNRALQLNPRHRGAHEYLGEAYLMVGNLAKAEEHLAMLAKICLIPCDEYALLERRIAEKKGLPK